MKKTDAITHFGGVPALSELLQTSPQAIYKWPDEVPRPRQSDLDILSGGALRSYIRDLQPQNTSEALNDND
ncbi:MAG: Cro/CI family transcriptional regulator [Pseudomonadota bacterium]